MPDWQSSVPAASLGLMPPPFSAGGVTKVRLTARTYTNANSGSELCMHHVTWAIIQLISKNF